MKKIFSLLSVLLLSLACFGQVKTYPAETRLVAEAQELFDTGEDLFKAGNTAIANYYYGQAVTLLESFDYAVCVLNYIKNTSGPEDESEDNAAVIAMMKRMGMSGSQLDAVADTLNESAEETVSDYDNIFYDYYKILACKSLVSPWPDFFMGMIEDYKGNGQKAGEYYLRAAANPYMIQDIPDFSFLESMSVTEMKALSSRLQDKILKFGYNYTENDSQFLDTPNRWNPAWHLAKANEFLQEDNISYPLALQYCENAVKTFPFQVEFYILGATLAILSKNGEKLVKFINGGLDLEPDNAKLKQMADKLNTLIDSTK